LDHNAIAVPHSDAHSAADFLRLALAIHASAACAPIAARAAVVGFYAGVDAFPVAEIQVFWALARPIDALCTDVEDLAQLVVTALLAGAGA
jgi:hypothetical protein